MDITGIILAGGKSRRMGTNKALLIVGGKRNIERMTAVMKEITDYVYIIANEKAPYEFLLLPIVSDRIAGSGPLAGIHSGILASDTTYCFVTACDYPFLSVKAMQYMMKQCEGYDGVVPIIHGRKHPLVAIYHRSILPVVEEHLDAKNLKIMNLLSKLNIRYVDETEFLRLGEDMNMLFLNMNKPEDYEVAKDHF